MSENNTGILEIIRPSMYFAKYRSYPIFVDSEKVGTLKMELRWQCRFNPDVITCGVELTGRKATQQKSE